MKMVPRSISLILKDVLVFADYKRQSSHLTDNEIKIRM